MEHDPLAPYRRNGATAQVKPPQEATPEVYTPYRIAESAQPRLWLRGRGNDADHAPGYGAIYDIVTDGRTGITLALPHMVIDIDGRNLGALFYELVRQRVEWIRAFDLEKWPEPDAALPLVTRIAVRMTQAAPSPRPVLH
jgi:hypothetical protein